MSAIPTSPLTIGQVLDLGFRLFRASFKGIVPVAFVASVVLLLPSVYITLYPDEFVQAVSGGDPTFWAYWGVLYVISVLVYMWAFGAMVHYGDAVARDGERSLGASLRRGLACLLVMFLAMLLFMVAVSIGMVLLLIPGIILSVSLLFTGYCVVLEGQGPVRALRRSHRLVWGKWWRTLAILSVLMIIYLVLYLAIGLPFSLVDELVMEETPPTGGLFGLVGQGLASTVALPFLVTTLLAAFYDLRLRSEGGDLIDRADDLIASS